MAKGEHTEDRRGGLFDDLSFSQVAAGALAAVTSMLLASQIGIYGSAIGVGVGSVVSAVASQLYKRFLQRSADKLREAPPLAHRRPHAPMPPMRPVRRVWTTPLEPASPQCGALVPSVRTSAGSNAA